jgi:hypothetical protein
VGRRQYCDISSKVNIDGENDDTRGNVSLNLTRQLQR